MAAEAKQDLVAELKKVASTPVKIVGISGSIRKASFNSGILRVIEAAKIEGVEFEIVSVADLPVFNQDIENMKDEAQNPKAVQEFHAKLRGADAFFFACPEYNYGISSPMKNAIDWGSRSPTGNCWKNKCATVVGAGGGLGTGRAQYQFRQCAVFIELRMITKPECLVKAFEKEADGKMVVDFGSGDIVSDKWKGRLVAQCEALRDFYREQKMGELAFASLCKKE